MGVRGKRNQGANDSNEPPLLSDINSVLKIAREKGYINGSDVDIESIVADEGIEVIEEVMPSSTSGYLKCVGGKWRIGINQLHNIRRKKFTIAHEFAHYVLHREEATYFEDITFFRKDNNSSIEYKANEFAAQLLMPEDLINDAINKGINSIPELSDLFNVSVLAVTFRVKELGYIIKEG